MSAAVRMSHPSGMRHGRDAALPLHAMADLRLLQHGLDGSEGLRGGQRHCTSRAGRTQRQPQLRTGQRWLPMSERLCVLGGCGDGEAALTCGGCRRCVRGGRGGGDGCASRWRRSGERCWSGLRCCQCWLLQLLCAWQRQLRHIDRGVGVELDVQQAVPDAIPVHDDVAQLHPLAHTNIGAGTHRHRTHRAADGHWLYTQQQRTRRSHRQHWSAKPQRCSECEMRARVLCSASSTACGSDAVVV